MGVKGLLKHVIDTQEESLKGMDYRSYINIPFTLSLMGIGIHTQVGIYIRCDAMDDFEKHVDMVEYLSAALNVNSYIALHGYEITDTLTDELQDNEINWDVDKELPSNTPIQSINFNDMSIKQLEMYEDTLIKRKVVIKLTCERDYNGVITVNYKVQDGYDELLTLDGFKQIIGDLQGLIEHYKLVEEYD